MGVTSKKKAHGVPHSPAAPTLELSHVSVIYGTGGSSSLRIGREPYAGDRYALQDITFRVSAGQKVAVVGPNGAGKSTLFKLIAGTVKPSSGAIRVYGHGPAGHTCIAYVPQRNQFDWSFPVTAADVVMMGRAGQLGLFRWPRHKDRETVNHCLERVDATHLARKRIGELSGGQQQRIFIARALAQEAELLLMDEPLSGLDAPSREAISDILDGLGSAGVTVLVATHDLNLAAERFDRIMLLNSRIIAFGQPSDVLAAANLFRAYGGHKINGTLGI